MHKVNFSLFETFSKKYYHLLTEKNDIANRTQTFFVVYISVLGALFYMLRMIDYNSNCILLTIYYILISISVVLIFLSIYFSVKSLSGYEYLILPSSEEIKKYKDKLIEYRDSIEEYNSTYNTNEAMPNIKNMLDDFILESYSLCNDKNQKINQFRRDLFKKGLKILFFSFIPLLLATSIFIIADMDASSPRKIDTSFNDDSILIETLKEIKAGSVVK